MANLEDALQRVRGVSLDVLDHVHVVLGLEQILRLALGLPNETYKRISTRVNATGQRFRAERERD